MDVNDLAYGNPTFEQLGFVRRAGIVDALYEEFKSHLFPANDSEQVKEELNEIVNCLDAVREQENLQYLKRYKSYDRNLVQALTSIFMAQELNVEDLCAEVSRDIESLVYKLKFYHQRPRPNQLSHYHKLKLFPMTSFSSNSPSFPCGHSTLAYVVLKVIGNQNPSIYNYCMELFDDVSNSRKFLGLQYDSDIEAAKELGEAILKTPEFAKKYKI